MTRWSGEPRWGDEGFKYRKRILAAVSHAFEFALVAFIAFACLLQSMQPLELMHHVCFSASTIALVHCFETVRHMSERIALCGECKDIAYDFKNKDLARAYHALLHITKIDRGFFTVSTVVNAVGWSVVALGYVHVLVYVSRGAFDQVASWIHYSSGFSSAVSLVIAGAKVWAASDVPDELSPSWLVAELRKGQPVAKRYGSPK